MAVVMATRGPPAQKPPMAGRGLTMGGSTRRWSSCWGGLRDIDSHPLPRRQARGYDGAHGARRGTVRMHCTVSLLFQP